MASQAVDKSGERKIIIETRTFIRFWLVPAALVAFGWFVFMTREAWVIIAVSAFLAFALNPVVAFLVRKIPGRAKSRAIATAVAYVVVIAILGLAIGLIVPLAWREGSRLLENLPEMADSATQGWGELNGFLEQQGLGSWRDQLVNSLSNFATDFTSGIGGHILNSLKSASDGIIAALITLVMTFFMLTSGPKLWDAFWRRFDDTRHGKTKRVLLRMQHTVVQFMAGQLVIGLIDMVLVSLSIAIFCLIFNLPLGLALPLGVASGILNMIPFGGAVISFFMVGIVLMFVSVPAAIAFLIYYLIYQQVENNIIIPKIQSHSSQLPILIVFIAVTIGLYFGGIIGMLFAVPIAGCIKILLEEYFFKPVKAVDAKII